MRVDHRAVAGHAGRGSPRVHCGVVELSDLDYDLPRAAIAQAPPETREAARLLVIDRAGGDLDDRRVSDLPVALGFGISKPEHVREVGQWADAAVVGSALVSVIADAGISDDLNTRVEEYVRWLKS